MCREDSAIPGGGNSPPNAEKSSMSVTNRLDSQHRHLNCVNVAQITGYFDECRFLFDVIAPWHCTTTSCDRNSRVRCDAQHDFAAMGKGIYRTACE